MKKETDIWQYHFRFCRDFRMVEPGWKIFEIGYVNIHTIPDEGQMLLKEHYKGYMFRCRFFWPFEFMNY